VAEPVDSLVEDVIVGRLLRPDAVELLVPASTVDLGALHAEATAIRVELDELAAARGRREIDVRSYLIACKGLQEQLDQHNAQLQAVSTSTAVASLLTAPDLRRAWFGAAPDRSDGMSLEQRSAVISALMRVTILPTRKGRKPGGESFDPASVRIDWVGNSAA
jgi:hypothetical protein